jgi:hypothetical protein
MLLNVARFYTRIVDYSIKVIYTGRYTSAVYRIAELQWVLNKVTANRSYKTQKTT